MRVFIQQFGRGVRSARTPLHIVDEELSPINQALCGFGPYNDMYHALEYDAERDGQRLLCRRCQAQQDRRAGRGTSKRDQYWRDKLAAWRKMSEAI